MADGDKRPRKVIVAPAADPKGAVGRAILEAAAGIEPITGFFSRLYQTTHPPKSEIERANWQREITDRSNELDERVDRHERLLSPATVELSDAQQAVVVAILRANDTGMEELFTAIEDVAEQLPKFSPDEVEEAAHGLVEDRLLEGRHTTGPWQVRATQLLFETFDAEVMGWSTVSDAVALAALMLADDQHQSPDLANKTGWPIRRMNPALQYLMNAYPDWSWRDHFGQPYPSYGLVIGSCEKSGLKRFIAVHEKSVTR